MENMRFIQESLELTELLLRTAEDGEKECTQDDCLLFFGVVRDCAYKIQAAAEQCSPGPGTHLHLEIGFQSR